MVISSPDTWCVVLGDLSHNTGWVTGFSQAPPDIPDLFDQFVLDASLTRAQFVSVSPHLGWLLGINLGWIEDFSWIGTSHNDVQHVSSRLPIAGNLTNLFWDATKAVGFGIALQGKQVTFGRQPIQISRMPLRIPKKENTFESTVRSMPWHVLMFSARKPRFNLCC